MNPTDDRAYHRERAEQCRKMAAESTDSVVRQLHEELAAFHEAEAERESTEFGEEEDAI